MTKKSIDKLVIRLYFSYFSGSVHQKGVSVDRSHFFPSPVHQNGQSVDRSHFSPVPSTKRANRWTAVTLNCAPKVGH